MHSRSTEPGPPPGTACPWVLATAVRSHCACSLGPLTDCSPGSGSPPCAGGPPLLPGCRLGSRGCSAGRCDRQARACPPQARGEAGVGPGAGSSAFQLLTWKNAICEISQEQGEGRTHLQPESPLTNRLGPHVPRTRGPLRGASAGHGGCVRLIRLQCSGKDHDVPITCSRDLSWSVSWSVSVVCPWSGHSRGCLLSLRSPVLKRTDRTAASLRICLVP